MKQGSDSDLGTSSLAAADKMGDNRGAENPTAADGWVSPPNTTHTVDESYWHKALEELRGFATQTCQELKGIGIKLRKLDKIEISTDSLAKQMTEVLKRTSTLEEVSTQNTSKINSLKEEVQSLRSTIAAHEKDIAELKTIKKDFITVNADFVKKSNAKVQEFSDLIGVQQKQVDAFHATNQKIQDTIQDNITQHVDHTIKVWTDSFNLKSLKDQASRNKNNLVIIGLEEEDKSPLQSASNFIKTTLGIKNVQIDVAYRLGPPPPAGSSYARPIWLRFTHRADRNKVWRGKTTITSEDGDRKIRIQQDLPKLLREFSQIINRVLKAAATHPKYKSAKFIDYKIRLNGRDYDPTQLELLPKAIRPSTLATRSSETALVFFTRHAAFSNHHPSPFTLKGTSYANMEHYLAHRRALLSEDQDMIQRALAASDPLEAKSVLNALKHDHVEQWEDRVENTLIAGLRQKFKQNDNLLKYLKNTQGLELGEASKDPKWGIGMSLDDADVLDSTKWIPSGNRLGRALSKIREEVLANTSVDLSQARPQPNVEEGTAARPEAREVPNPQENNEAPNQDRPKDNQDHRREEPTQEGKNEEISAKNKSKKSNTPAPAGEIIQPGKPNTSTRKEKPSSQAAALKDPAEKKITKSKQQTNPPAAPSVSKERRK